MRVYKLFVILLLGLVTSVSTPMAWASSGVAHRPEAASSSTEDFNKNLAMAGSAVLGALLASGTVGLVSAVSMMSEGVGFAEAMEGGARLSLPMTFLSAALGVMFAQDWVLHTLVSFRSGETQKAEDHH